MTPRHHRTWPPAVLKSPGRWAGARVHGGGGPAMITHALRAAYVTGQIVSLQGILDRQRATARAIAIKTRGSERDRRVVVPQRSRDAPAAGSCRLPPGTDWRPGATRRAASSGRA